MDHAYPYRLEPDDAGGMLLQCIDVPEAHTIAPAAPDAATDPALDCLIAALGGYIKLGRPIPRPSTPRGHSVAILPPLVAARLALYHAMRTQHITRTALARRLGLQENAVRRLLDLDHRSHIDRIARAIATLGRRLEVRVLEST